MATLVIAEYTTSGSAGGALDGTTLSTVAAARKIGGEVHILVAGQNVSGVAGAAARIEGVTKVLLADDAACAHRLPENLAPFIVDLVRKRRYSHVLAPATLDGKNMLPRIAALLDVDQISEIIDVLGPDTFKRAIYAGNAVATVQSTAAVTVLSVRGTAFEPVDAEGGEAVIEPVSGAVDAELSSFLGEELSSSDRPELGTAKIVVAGGRGLQNEESFALLYSLADKLGAAVGASLAAVESGFAPNDLQVGQSGKIIAPQLYIAVGISGAIQHVAGIKDSKVIVAINLDKDAPIFQVADYGLVGDLFELLPELEKAL
ncbi:Electron transfer flavoprotein subunit alpha [compost metagenome]